MNDDLVADRDPWEERLRFGQLFLRYLDTLGRPFLPDGQPPITAANYLEMIALGEMLAEADRNRAAAPDYYRDAAYLHGALTAGATWTQIAEATGRDEAAARLRYREWADDQHRRGDPGRRRVSGPRSSERKAGTDTARERDELREAMEARAAALEEAPSRPAGPGRAG